MKKKPAKAAVKKGLESVNVDLPARSVPWTVEHRQALSAFLRSPVGQVLQNNLMATVAAGAEWAIDQSRFGKSPISTDRACGQVQGLRMMFRHILSLAAAQSSTTEPPADTDGTADKLAHLRP